MKGMLIAATSSNVGKTSITLGLMQLMKRKGYDIYPFKVGPDYIDPAYHQMIAGRYSNNLDEALMTNQAIMNTIQEVPHDGFAIAEGVMGLFDGVEIDGLEGSSANMAILSGLPIVLIVDGRGQSQSVAATVKGFNELYPGVNIAGVIINRINTKRHFELLEAAISHHCGVPCLGYVPNVEDINFKSRHLGLYQAFEVDGLVEKIDKFANVLEESLNIALIEEIANMQIEIDGNETIQERPATLRLGVAMDEAFSFYYPYNFRVLASYGVEVVPFSPIHDEELPKVDGLYLGGGYPELHGQALESNDAMRNNIREVLKSGMPCYAECGGYMYLNQELETLEGAHHKMVGYFDGKAKMTERLQRFGYVKMTMGHNHLRGHEFHRSLVEGNEHEEKAYQVEFLSKRREGTWEGGVIKNRTLAGYPHVHFASGICIVEQLVKWMNEYKKG